MTQINKWHTSITTLYESLSKTPNEMPRILVYTKPWSTLILPTLSPLLEFVINHYRRALDAWGMPLDDKQILQLELLYAWMLEHQEKDNDRLSSWLVSLRYLLEIIPAQEQISANVFFLLVCFSRLSSAISEKDVQKYKSTTLINKARDTKWCKAYPSTSLILLPLSAQEALELRTRQILEEQRLVQEEQRELRLLIQQEEARKLLESRFAAIRAYKAISNK